MVAHLVIEESVGAERVSEVKEERRKIEKRQREVQTEAGNRELLMLTWEALEGLLMMKAMG